MDFIPAIDLKDGACVRLRQGRLDDATCFSDDPITMALHWVKAGAKRLHVVDLNGAFEGSPVHFDIIAQIIATVPTARVQVGGGVRDLNLIERYLKAGASKVILGTKAVREPAFLEAATTRFPHSILFGLDARDGMVALSGWTESANKSAGELIQTTDRLPLAGVIYTDIIQDGMLTGINVEDTLALAKISRVPVIASGGVATLRDLASLLQAQQDTPLDAVISGRALYEGSLDCAQAIALCQQH